jgi:hypothetical protein
VKIVVPAVVLLAAGPAMAHHSFAMFDSAKTLTFGGTVRQFQFTNPHSWLQVEAADGSGGVKEWSLEMNTLVGLRRAGWRPGTLKAGDKVSVVFHPIRDGSSAGQLLTVTLADGTVLNAQANGPGAVLRGGDQVKAVH